MQIDLEYVAVAKASCTSTWNMLLWLRFCAHRLRECCCGLVSVDIDLVNVAVADVMLLCVWFFLAVHCFVVIVFNGFHCFPDFRPGALPANRPAGRSSQQAKPDELESLPAVLPGRPIG